MSAYIVDDETINKVVSYLYSRSIEFQHTKLHKMGYDVNVPKSCAELAQKMFDLNVAAVNARYGEDEAEKFRSLNFKYGVVPASLIEVIQALKAWKYQCTEGDVPDLALYKAMKEIHCLLCIKFVEQSEEYRGAAWG